MLTGIEWEVRRRTLIAQRQQRGSEVVYRLDIHLQHADPARETVFFDV